MPLDLEILHEVDIQEDMLGFDWRRWSSVNAEERRLFEQKRAEERAEEEGAKQVHTAYNVYPKFDQRRCGDGTSLACLSIDDRSSKAPTPTTYFQETSRNEPANTEAGETQ
jgi:hypothetical protein